jgi:ribosome-associated translation inhibitor RaiA
MAIADIEVTAPEDAPPDQIEAAREKLASLERSTGQPILGTRLTLRHPQTRKARDIWVADASVLVNGRLVAAHATGSTPAQAADAVTDRLRRQVRRLAGSEVALRNEPRVIQRALASLDHDRAHRPGRSGKPAGERRIVHRRTVEDDPKPTLQAVEELIERDWEFNLFRHARTGEHVVVHRRDDGSIGLIHPPGSELADEVIVLPPDGGGDDDETILVAPEPSRYDRELTLEEAREELGRLDHRFVYFIDAADGLGKVLYLRHDGDYGLVEPA